MFREHFRSKSSDELSGQVKNAELRVGHNLVPASEKQDILSMSLLEIKRKYPRRYEMYVRLLQKENKIENGLAENINEDELKGFRKWLRMLNSLDEYILNHQQKHEVDIRGRRQNLVFEDIRRFMEGENIDEDEFDDDIISGDDSLVGDLEEKKGEGVSADAAGEYGENNLLDQDLRGYIKLPTGTGKTVLFSRLVEALGAKALIVVPTKVLVKQTGEKIEKFTDLAFSQYYSGDKNLDKNTVITTYDSLLRGLKNGQINPDDFGCLILDEAHHSLTNKQIKAVNRFNNSIKFGFTATPNYSERKRLSNLLPTEIHAMGVGEAVKEGLLSGVRVVVAETQTDISSVPLIRGDYNQQELEKIVNVAERNQGAVELYKKAFLGEKTVCYCAGIGHAKALSNIFLREGINAAVISGEQSKKDRDDIIRRYALPVSDPNHIDVLCNAQILIEGFDEPQASVCMNLKPTASEVVEEQRSGRVLRLDPSNLNKVATVVDFLDKNSRRPAVLFSDIIGGAEVLSDNMALDNYDLPHENKIAKIADLDIPGLVVHVSTTEIMSILKELLEQRRKSYLSLAELQKAVAAVGNIESRRGYEQYRMMHPAETQGWHCRPERFYDEFPGWEIFLGKDFLLYEELRAAVNALGIKSRDEYLEYIDAHPKETKRWPHVPDSFYKEWPKRWGLFLDHYVRYVKSLTYEQLRSAVQAAGISSFAQYWQYKKDHPAETKAWPREPYRTYEDAWEKNDQNFFVKKKFISMADFKERLAMHNITTSPDYARFRNQHPELVKNWPAFPKKIYKDEWPGWSKFLGRGLLSYDELAVQVRQAHINSMPEYERYRAEHPEETKKWPARPSKEVYKEFPGWPVFLDKK
ncbi:MAG: DEAD/DEAH box helicase [Candidatus Magasanikbacteria bacterium]